MESYDAVVIGAGPNGLVAANLLADAGWSVVVLEAGHCPGGAVRSTELMEPGFTNDLCSAFYPFARVSPLGRLDLERFGLRWVDAPLVLAHPAPNGTCPVLSRDIDVTAASLDALHPGDGDAWRALYDQWTKIRGPYMDLLLGPFPPVRAGARLALRLRRDLGRFVRMQLLPTRRFGEEHFSGPYARRLLAGAALHADLNTEAPFSALYGWLLCMLGQDVGFPVPAGGAQAITDALVARLSSLGGRVICGSRVDRVMLDGRRAVGVITGGDLVPARRAVLADVGAPRLFNDLVGATNLPSRFVADLQRFEYDDPAFKVDWNLDRPIPWAATEARAAGTVHTGDSVDALSIARSALAVGAIPAHPALIIGQQSMTDQTRQPAGCETAWAYTHLPRSFSDSRSFGPDERERLADQVQAEIERLAPGFESSIRRRHILDPFSLEAHDENLVGGAIGGGTAQPHQLAVFRPVPGWGRAETPIRALYLASASAHPGGGVHGAPGANAARAARFHDVVGRNRSGRNRSGRDR